MATKRYEMNELTKFAEKLIRLKEGNGEFKAVMRERFPRISDYAIREAYKNAKIVVAIKQAGRLD
jgi:hypothetical protein